MLIVVHALPIVEGPGPAVVRRTAMKRGRLSHDGHALKVARWPYAAPVKSIPGETCAIEPLRGG